MKFFGKILFIFCFFAAFAKTDDDDIGYFSFGFLLGIGLVMIGECVVCICALLIVSVLCLWIVGSLLGVVRFSYVRVVDFCKERERKMEFSKSEFAKKIKSNNKKIKEKIKSEVIEDQKEFEVVNPINEEFDQRNEMIKSESVARK